MNKDNYTQEIHQRLYERLQTLQVGEGLQFEGVIPDGKLFEMEKIPGISCKVFDASSKAGKAYLYQFERKQVRPLTLTEVIDGLAMVDVKPAYFTGKLTADQRDMMRVMGYANIYEEETNTLYVWKSK